MGGYGWLSAGPASTCEWRWWGLYLVEQVASRWGVEDGGPGTLVWFEVGGADGQISAAEPA